METPNRSRLGRREALKGLGVFMMGLSAGAFCSPLSADARVKKPGESIDQFSKEELGEFGYREMGHNFISGSGAVIWRPDHQAISAYFERRSGWMLLAYEHPLKDLGIYLGVLTPDGRRIDME